MENNRINRREFIQIGVVAGTGLALGVQVVPSWLEAGDTAAVFCPSQWLCIDRQGLVTITVHRTELGQGPRTALPQIVAEELDADWKQIRFEPAPAGDLFKDPVWNTQSTGGSTSVRHMFLPLRKAGAAAREMLVAAAAKKWKVAPGSCRAENGRVVDGQGRSLGFGELADVVVVAAHTGEERIGADGLGRRLGEVGHRQGVLEGPGRLDGQPLEQGDLLVDEKKDRIVVAIDADLFHLLRMAGAFAFQPELLP